MYVERQYFIVQLFTMFILLIIYIIIIIYIVLLRVQVCHSNKEQRSRFLTCIYNLLHSSSPAVRYEAAGTLVTLSGKPTAIEAAATCYIELIVKESDNNVKLIVLDRLISMAETHAKVIYLFIRTECLFYFY